MEKVYVENVWYDGPRKGIADFNGVPHRFVSNFDDLKGCHDTFKVFPVTEEELALEIEQWKIYAEWNKKYELGEVETDTHPGHGDIDKRWDEIEDILKPMREVIPSSALEIKATLDAGTGTALALMMLGQAVRQAKLANRSRGVIPLLGKV